MNDVEMAQQPVDNDSDETTDVTASAADETAATDEAAESTGRRKPSRRGRRQQHQGVYNCTSCSRSFSSRREMVTHQYMHRENPATFCAICNKSFSSESAYRRHAASHTRKATSTPRPRKTCCQCNMQFDTMRQLSAHHAEKHVDEKRFICAICGSQFAWPENLKAHQRTHELDPHECEICGRRFVDATSLRVHTRNSHGPSSETPPQRKQHCCKVCGRSFQFDFSLRAHMKGHAQSPVAASLHWSKRLSKSSSTAAPVTQTKYVHVDSKGVIDLGMDVAQTPVNQPSEIIVEVYNYQSSDTATSDNTQQPLDFSDVLDQSQSQFQTQDQSQIQNQSETQDQFQNQFQNQSETQDQFQTQTQDQLQSTVAESVDETEHDGEQVGSEESSVCKLVWYVKPDSHNERQTQLSQDQQLQHNDDGDNVCDVNVKSVEQSVASNQHNDQLKPPAAAAAAAAAEAAVNNGDSEAGEVNDAGHTAYVQLTDAEHQPALCRHDNNSQHQQPEAKITDVQTTVPAAVASSVPAAVASSGPAAVASSLAVVASGLAPVASSQAVVASDQAVALAESNIDDSKDTAEDEDEDEDDEDDEIDWMDTEPPRRRAAPFIYRQSTNVRRRATRPREPFLFNCVMTDEKPFMCLTCGQCFRWEISLNIHQRLHVEGTFPNKSRGSRQPTQQSAKSRGKSKSSSPSKSSVGRSCIVRNRRTSSDEDDDEFTFHVHADGPAEVSSHYSSQRRQAGSTERGRGQGQGRGRGRGRGQGRGRGVVTVAVVKRAALSPSNAIATKPEVDVKSNDRAGCNGVNCDTIGVTVHADTAAVCAAAVKSTADRTQLRGGYVCRECDRVITSLAALKRHQRRSHPSTAVVCQFCSAHFTSRWDLRRHCQRQHDSVGVSTIKCRRCSRVFTDSSRLKRHYKLHEATVKPSAHHKPVTVST